jgi:rhamnosyltransferase
VSSGQLHAAKESFGATIARSSRLGIAVRMNANVCAAIVTYYPDTDFERAVEVLRPQVGRLVVIDNRSPEETLKKLRALAKKFDFVLIENSDNYGIGAALNQAIAWAQRHSGCEFILFFDQDSLPSETFVAEMTHEYGNHSNDEKIFLVMPKIVHQRSGLTHAHYAYHGAYLVAQTSGSLMPIRVFADEGLYREDLFIDYVDYEFCLRVATHGWKIIYCPSAILLHNPGEVEQFSLLGLRKVTTTNHSPLRRYYLMRNGLWTIRHYAGTHPGWAAAHTWQMSKEVVRVLLFEKNRTSIFLMWLRAIRDAVRSRLGRYSSTVTV